MSDTMNEMSQSNMSGKGDEFPVPDAVAKRFNWGAFFLTWIWGLGNKTYITFLIFIAYIAHIIPFLGALIALPMQIWFGIKGNTWAWQNKQFESVDAFHEYQKKWAIAGVIIAAIYFFVLLFLLLSLPTLIKNTNKAEINAFKKKVVVAANQITNIQKNTGVKCDLSSEGLADCFAKNLNVKNKDNNVLTLADDTIWVFNGDGICSESGDCNIQVSTGKNVHILDIPLKLADDNYLNVDDSVNSQIEQYK